MTKTSRRRLAAWGGLGLVLTIGLVAALRPRPAAVDQATIARGPLMVTIDHEGRTRVRDRYVVSAPVTGRVLRIELEPGDRVAAGRTVLARMRPGASPLLDARTRAEVQARAQAAEATLQRARAERDRVRTESEHATTERERARMLAREGLATAQARLAAEAQAAALAQALVAAESAVEAAANDMRAARAALIEPGGRPSVAARGTNLNVYSPVDGVVLRRLQESEVDVPQGQPLLEVADLSTLEVMADFLSTDAVRIEPGMAALIEQWGGATPLRARVRRVEPSGFLKLSALGVEEQRVWVYLSFEDLRTAAEALGDGYRVEARVIEWEARDTLLVPVAALFRRGTSWAVFLVEDGRARVHPLRIGHRNGSAAEVLSGLRPGDHVVVHPPDDLVDGARVSPRGQ